MKLNSEDIPVFIINLKHSVERKKHMQELCEKYNLNYKFIEAIDGRTLSEDKVSKIYSKKKAIKASGREMTRGEIGVLLSQKSIYEEMLRENIEVALIFEDDIEFDNKLMMTINNIDSFPKHWNLILLGHHPMRGREAETDYSFWSQKKIIENHKLARPRELALGAYGYILKKSAAKILFDDLSLITRPIDHLTGSDEKLNLYAMIPPVIYIHQHLSDNHHNMEDRQKLRDELKIIRRKKEKPIIYSRKRKLLIFLHLDDVWDNMNNKYIRLKQFLKKQRKYTNYD